MIMWSTALWIAGGAGAGGLLGWAGKGKCAAGGG